MTDRLAPAPTAAVDPAREFDRLLDFYDAAVDPRGGFFWMGHDGTPLPRDHAELWLNARMTYCYALAELAGRQGAAATVEHGLAMLEGPLRDRTHGGWFASTRADAGKEAYGHAHVLLASAAAVRAGHDRAHALLGDALATTLRFREPAERLFVDAYDARWSALEPYRGANANMHLTEALLAAGEALGDPVVTGYAVDVLDRILGEFAAAHAWRIPEHYDEQWRVDPEYNRDNPRNPFRPYGATIGHWYEWARLSINAWVATGRRDDRHVQRALALVAAAERDGAGGEGTLLFTVSLGGEPSDRDRYHWPVTEAIGAAHTLGIVTGDTRFDAESARFWALAQRDFIDLEHGSWIHQLDENGNLSTTVWEGKPDLYHTLQASLIPRLPLASDLASALATA